MSNWYMLTLVGRDQPGIVARLTRVLYERGCNLGETSMIRLGSSFTVMMMVESSDSETDLRVALQPVTESLQLVLHIDAIEAGFRQRPAPDVCIVVYGADRAGIVAEVTGNAAAGGLNILDLESEIGGTETDPIYILQIQGVAGQGIEALQEALAPLQASGVQVDVRPIETMIG
jgi:glycine cleavage system transcriptional repressor